MNNDGVKPPQSWMMAYPFIYFASIILIKMAAMIALLKVFYYWLLLHGMSTDIHTLSLYIMCWYYHKVIKVYKR